MAAPAPGKGLINPDGCRIPAKRVPKGLFVPQRSHFSIVSEAPQLLQNFPSPAGLPHCGQSVCLLSISPWKTCVSGLLLDIIDHLFARAEAISTFIRGAHSTQRPSCSFQSFSQSHWRHFGSSGGNGPGLVLGYGEGGFSAPGAIPGSSPEKRSLNISEPRSRRSPGCTGR